MCGWMIDDTGTPKRDTPLIGVARQLVRVRLNETAQLSAALDAMLRNPATKPVPNDAI